MSLCSATTFNFDEQQTLIPKCFHFHALVVFLVNVVRVLCNKLHPGTAQLAPLALQKALRATLILVSYCFLNSNFKQTAR